MWLKVGDPMNRHFLLLHYLRGFAALMVLAFHSVGSICGKTCGYEFLANLGVDIFFVISGFVMWNSTSGRDMTPMEFYTRRFFRVAPLYYLMTFLVALVALLAPHVLRTTVFDWRHLFDSLMFMPSPLPKTGEIFPVVIPGWTLNFEMFFYMIFATCLALPMAARLPAVLITIVGLVIVGTLFQPQGLYTKFYTSQIMLEFVYGIAIAAIIDKLRQKSIYLWVSAFAAAVIIATLTFAHVISGLSHQMTFGIMALLCVWAVCEIDVRYNVARFGFLKWIGDVSFSIYLLQMATIGTGFVLWRAAGLPLGSLAIVPFLLLVTAMTFACSYFTFKFIELPMQRLGTEYAKKIGDWERGLQEASQPEKPEFRKNLEA
jgi:exopolysaccharide production protein ExoZ